MYPGRIYINMANHSIFTASVDRLVNFAQDRIITHVLGTHIEQRGPYVDYPVGSTFAPNEARLQLTYGQLLELQQAAHDLGEDGRSSSGPSLASAPAEPTRNATRSCRTGALEDEELTPEQTPHG